MTSSPSSRPPRGSDRADALVIFGLAGDLGESKLFDALDELRRDGLLRDIPVIGAGRTERSDDEIVEMFDHATGGRSDESGPAIDLHYQSGSATEPDTFDRLAERIGDARRPVVYAAVPPALFADLAVAIESSAMPDDTRLVVEKPFGTDATSARDLFSRVGEALGPDRLLIVDHFLAKASVENLLTTRLDNALFDRVLHRDAVCSVRIDLLEEGDVEGRESFYEGVGVVDDVVQNHILQLAAMALMEGPTDDTVEAYHAARGDVLRNLTIDRDTIVFGQYAGYREHDDVDDDSIVPTYCAFTMNLDSDRWRGVPIRVRTGKALDTTSTAVTFELQDLQSPDGHGSSRNTISFGIKPDPTISLGLSLLSADDHGPSPTRDTEHVEAILCGPGTHGSLGDYATLFADALDDSSRHFATIDDVVASWEVVSRLDPSRHDLQPYRRGSSGPT